jgi:hypothetical protein
LEKKGAWEFLKDKVKRLLIPWALAVLILLPLATYQQPIKPVSPFWKYWLWYLSSFEVRQIPQGPTTQAIYWFISQLFAFFLLFALVFGLMRRWRTGGILPAQRKATSDKSVLVALVIFGLLTSAGYFILLLLFPDWRWYTLQMFLEFQVTRIIPHAGYFALGVYAQSHGWFTDGKPLGSLALWGTISAVFVVAHLVVGQPVFAGSAGTTNLSAGFLLIFAFIRSFSSLSLLVVFVSFGARYWNHASGLDRQLSATSYNIYLTHYWSLLAIQAVLPDWAEGPVLIKGAILFVAGLALSFALSRWVLARHAPAFAVAILSLFVLCLAVRS